MVLSQGFVLLSDQDTDAPATPCVASVSTDNAWDHGALALGQAAASQGRLWVDRPYFVGNPDVGWLVERLDRCTSAGGYGQCGNELNLELEGWSGGAGAWFELEDQVRAEAAHPDRVLSMPPSPGVAGWQDWVREDAWPKAIHCYGGFDEMRAIVEWYLAYTAGELHVTECNFAAGRTVDRDAWAHEELRPFLDWCATQPRVASVSYFAWRWENPDSTTPTPVDAAGTAIEDVIRDWTPPVSGGAPDPAPEADPIDAVRDQLWSLSDQAEALGHPWLGQGVKSAVALSKGDK